MNVNSPIRTTMKRLIPPLTMWAIGRILEMPSVKGNMMVLDGLANKKRYDLKRSLQRGVENAKANVPLIAAGAAAVIIGLGLMAKAATREA